jgi:hypothetical protein
MESLGEEYPAMVLQDYEDRMPVSKALRYLTEALDWTRRRKRSDEDFPKKEDGYGSVVGSSNSMQS